MQMLGIAAEPVDILDDEVARLTARNELQDLLQAGRSIVAPVMPSSPWKAMTSSPQRSA